jgi:hypothetical protein
VTGSARQPISRASAIALRLTHSTILPERVASCTCPPARHADFLNNWSNRLD